MRRVHGVALSVIAAAMMFALPAAAGPTCATSLAAGRIDAPLKTTKDCTTFCNANYPTHFAKCMQLCRAGGGN